MKQILDRQKLRLFLKRHRDDLKLNIGCGTDYKRGWINIDNNSDNNIENLDLNWDLMKPLPFADNSIKFIYNEHFMEHFSVEDGQKILKDFMRVLEPGGVLRIAMPDLEVITNNYVKLSLDKDPVIKRRKLTFIQTKAEWINMSFRWWGHQWLYDFEELKRRLVEAGFDQGKISRCKLNQSKYPLLRNLETREESNLIAEVEK